MTTAKDIQLSSKESMELIRALAAKKQNVHNYLIPGKIISFLYNAKNKEDVFDRTPLAFVLRSNKTHTLAINFHWAPLPLRMILVKKILKDNAKNIKLNKPLEFDYITLKGFLKRIGFAPIIRLYINARISKSGFVVPDNMLMSAAKLKSETFVGKNISADMLYRYAVQKRKSK